METVDFIICFSTEHPYRWTAIKLVSVNELYSRLAFWGSEYLTFARFDSSNNLDMLVALLLNYLQLLFTIAIYN